VDEPTGEAVVEDDADKSATTITGKRQILPSSMGLSVLVPSASKALDVVVHWGDYHPELADDHNDRDADPGPHALSAKPAEKPRQPARKIKAWARVPRQEKVRLKLDGVFDRPRQEPVPRSDGLRLVWLSRTAPQEALDSRLVPDGAKIVNIYLVNTRDPLRGPEKDQRMAFQVELTVTCAEGFVPRPSLSGLNSRMTTNAWPICNTAMSMSSPSVTMSRLSPRWMSNAGAGPCGQRGSPRLRSSAWSPRRFEESSWGWRRWPA